MPVALRLCLLAAASLLFSSCAKKGDPVEAAKTFFGLIANGRSSEAYESTALGFKAQQTEKNFAQTSRELGLINILSVTSSPPQFDGNSAKLDVEITDKVGVKAPLTVTLVDERGAWRIFSVRAPRNPEGGAAANLFGTVGKGRGFTDGVSHPKPSDAEIRQMVESTLLLFDAAVRAESFDGFYEEISEAWQDQVTKGKMKRAFQAFIDQKVYLDRVKGQSAVFYEPPSVSTDGLLTANGYYPGDPTNIVFAMKFIYETPKWRLFGLEVSLATALKQ